MNPILTCLLYTSPLNFIHKYALFDSCTQQLTAFHSRFQIQTEISRRDGLVISSLYSVSCAHRACHPGCLSVIQKCGQYSSVYDLLFPNRCSLIIKRRLHRTITVSYTHLDVYKRQRHNRLDFLPESRKSAGPPPHSFPVPPRCEEFLQTHLRNGCLLYTSRSFDRSASQSTVR